MRGVAGRRTPELTGTGGGRELVLGIALGTSFVAGVAGVVALLGGYDIAWAGRDVGAALLEAVMLGAAAGVLEELMFRGFVLQALERIGGSGVALAVTALIFGAMHLMNDGATLLAALTISVEAGLLLGAAFLWRRDLRFVIGIHLAWNATEALLGIPVSGGSMPGLWTTTVHGSDLLTGGGFGLEASVVTVLLSLVPTTLMLIAAHRRGSLRSVPWRRRSGRDVPLSPAPARTG
nr:CPBP family intramembrane glutamic endopeptidase [Nakamurella flavida]